MPFKAALLLVPVGSHVGVVFFVLLCAPVCVCGRGEKINKPEDLNPGWLGPASGSQQLH